MVKVIEKDIDNAFQIEQASNEMEKDGYIISNIKEFEKYIIIYFKKEKNE